MGCLKLKLQDYFQLVENSPIKYCGARFNNGIPLYYTYTKYNQLESKSLGAPLSKTSVPPRQSKTSVPPRQSDSLEGLSYSTTAPISYVKYFYAPDGSITAREVSGGKQNYEYDVKNQLTAVTDEQGNIIEQYSYDPAGNILKKTINGGKGNLPVVTTYEYDAANQLTSSLRSPSAKSNALRRTTYTYDSAGRMTREGNKTYQYGWLDKVMSITQNGKVTANYDYHVSGQIATASIFTTEGTESTEYEWDGLALIRKNSTGYTNEPAVTGGNPILADNNVLFNDMLGTTLGVVDSKGKKSFTPTATTAFGESTSKGAFFTGKPNIAGLGYAFLFRNYRANLGKWQTADPLGYPDGWNNLAYVNNGVTSAIDIVGTNVYHVVDSEAVNGLGHSAAIVGNPTFGYRIMNHRSLDGIGASMNGWEHKFDTLSQALKKLNEGRVGDHTFDKIQRFEATPAQDDIAYGAMLDAAADGYDWLTNNCLDVINDGIDAASISDGFGICPNDYFRENNWVHATFLNFSNVLNGIAE